MVEYLPLHILVHAVATRCGCAGQVQVDVSARTDDLDGNAGVVGSPLGQPDMPKGTLAKLVNLRWIELKCSPLPRVMYQDVVAFGSQQHQSADSQTRTATGLHCYYM